jgi:hypothetical protein
MRLDFRPFPCLCLKRKYVIKALLLSINASENEDCVLIDDC